MTDSIHAALRLGIPKILIQSAAADGVLDELISWAVTANDEDPKGAAAVAGTGPSPLPAAPAATPSAQRHTNTAPKVNQPSGLPLYDRNGIYVRMISDAEARRMVDGGHAEPVMPGGWRDRTDVEWTGVRLKVTPDPVWSKASLTHEDAQRIAGESGQDPTARAARIKFHFWRFEHDDKAPMVIPR